MEVTESENQKEQMQIFISNSVERVTKSCLDAKWILNDDNALAHDALELLVFLEKEIH